MKNWRVVRVTPEGTLHVEETGYWTKKGAQASATAMNNTFGVFAQFGNTMLGHNYWATSTDRIPLVEKALELARRETPNKR